MKRLEPKPRWVPTHEQPCGLDDHDPGDEDSTADPYPWWRFWTYRTGEPVIGLHPSLIYIYPPVQNHDAGDEDDYHNYIPSPSRSLGLRVWLPRVGYAIGSQDL